MTLVYLLKDVFTEKYLREYNPNFTLDGKPGYPTGLVDWR